MIKRIKKSKLKNHISIAILFILKLMQLLFYRYEKLRNLKSKGILINLIHYFATRAIKCTKEPNAILLESVKEHKSRVKRDVVKHRNGYFRPVCVTLSSPSLLLSVTRDLEPRFSFFKRSARNVGEVFRLSKNRRPNVNTPRIKIEL